MPVYDPSERLNWKQACTVLGCGKTKFYELIQSGALMAHRVGKKGLWVNRAECEKLMKIEEYSLDNDSLLS